MYIEVLNQDLNKYVLILAIQMLMKTSFCIAVGIKLIGEREASKTSQYNKERKDKQVDN